MITRCLVVALLSGILVASGIAGEAAKKEEPKPPALAELKAAVAPLLDGLALTADQKAKAEGATSDAAWKTAVEGFDTRRGKEIFRAAHAKMRELMPMVMMPKMMAHTMRKTMKERMAEKAGPPTAHEIAAIRDRSQKLMRKQMAPRIMGGLETLAAARMKELLVDKKVLVRALGDHVATAVLTDEQKPKLDKALADAGYPSTLTHGPDAVLIERMKQMIEKLSDEALAELDKEDAAKKKEAGKGKPAEF